MAYKKLKEIEYATQYTTADGTPVCRITVEKLK